MLFVPLCRSDDSESDEGGMVCVQDSISTMPYYYLYYTLVAKFTFDSCKVSCFLFYNMTCTRVHSVCVMYITIHFY